MVVAHRRSVAPHFRADRFSFIGPREMICTSLTTCLGKSHRGQNPIQPTRARPVSPLNPPNCYYVCGFLYRPWLRDQISEKLSKKRTVLITCTRPGVLGNSVRPRNSCISSVLQSWGPYTGRAQNNGCGTQPTMSTGLVTWWRFGATGLQSQIATARPPPCHQTR